ncbi:MAG TPA: site-specific integrase [Ktedonobacterales bacterium]|nr:site-specific integrase [Ktedonobacterales bacterium]
MDAAQLPLFRRKAGETAVLAQPFQIVVPTAEATVRLTIPAYYFYLQSAGYSKYTPADFCGDVRLFNKFVREKKLKDIKPTDVQQWIAYLKSPTGANLTAKTVSRKITALQNYFLWLVSEKVLSQNPMQDIHARKIISPLPEILFENECEQLVRASSTDVRLYLLLLLLLETGMKKEELLTLRVNHFDLSNPYAPEVWIRHTGEKVKKDRKLKLPPELTPAFNTYVASFGISDTLFPYTPRFIELTIADGAKRIGITKRVTAQILRDTCAVRLLRRGEHMEQVLTKLGLSPTTWEDAKEKYERLTARAI